MAGSKNSVVYALAGWLLLLCASGIAQEQVTRQQRADELFERYAYYNAATLYLELAAKKQGGLRTMERLADCYTRMNNYPEAENWLAKLVVAKGGSGYALQYARMLQINQKFDAAKAQFRAYYGKNSTSKELQLQLAQCDSALAWAGSKPGYALKNEEKLNTAYAEWGAAWLGNALVITSDRIAASAAKDSRYAWTNNGFFRVYSRASPGDTLVRFAFADDPMISGKLHLGPAVFSAAGDTVYLTISTPLPKNKLVAGWSEWSDRLLYTRRLELVMAVRKNGAWGSFTRFAYDNVNAWSLGQAALSANGSLLYFVSDMPGGQGKTDIWYCQKQANGTWGKPINCGKTINTREEEAFPTVLNNRLFFASTGLPGIGGYDLFEATGSKSSWSVPKNLKSPLNSTADDFWLLTKDGNSGYFSSNRPGGKGNDDLYSFQQLAAKTETPAPAQIVAAPTPPAESTPVTTLLTTAAPGTKFVLHNIYYDLDKYAIRPDAAAELDKLAGILHQYPSLNIELSSHTDARAGDEYNLILSQKRADSAVAYLVSKGISAGRLTAKGYGETQLVNRCANGVSCSEAEHQQNRRTEIKVLSR